MTIPFSRFRERWGVRKRDALAFQDTPAPAKRSIDAQALEDRVLFSASPLAEIVIGADASIDADFSADAFEPEPTTYGEVLATGLAPDVEQVADRSIAEDTTASLLVSISDIDTPLEDLTVTVSSSNDDLLNSNGISWKVLGDEGIRLDLSPAQNQSGSTEITFSVSDGSNTSTQTFDLEVKAVNDGPSSVSFDQLEITDLGDTLEIDLHAAFDDVETSDQNLIFSVEHFDANANAGLVDSMTIDTQRGVLIVDKAAGAEGTLQLLVRATDEAGDSILLGGIEEPIEVYDLIRVTATSSKPDTAAIGLKPISLLTHFAYFDYENGEYNYDEINESRFREVLHWYDWVNEDKPVVLNVEVDGFGNDEAGRDRLREIIRIAEEERPEIDFGFYRLLPERSWGDPVSHHRSQLDLELNVNTANMPYALDREIDYLEWLERNNEFRSATTSEGDSLGDAIGTVNPSLYTFYRDRPYGLFTEATVPSNSTLASDISFEEVERVKLLTTVDGKLPTGLKTHQDYYVVNATADGFQLSDTPDGDPILFVNDNESPIYVSHSGTGRSVEHDPDVRDWAVYAEQNIMEARKIGKPVNAFLSPSFRAVGQEYLEYEFFKMQLEVTAELADSITLFTVNRNDAEFHQNSEWWAALTDFMEEQQAKVKPLELSIENAPTNTAPEATDDQLSVGEGATANATVIFNDFDADGDSLTVGLVSGPSSAASFEIDTSGNFRYVHDGSETTEDSFTYRISDGNGGVDTAEVRFDITPINDAPELTVPQNQTVTQGESIAINGLQLSDIDSQDVTVALEVTDGTLSIKNLNGVTVLEGDGNDDSRIVLEGNVDALNAALATIDYENDGESLNSDQMTVRVIDENIAVSDSIEIAVTPRPLPLIDAEVPPQSVEEGRLLAIRDIRITEGDPRERVTVELSVENGHLSIPRSQSLPYVQVDAPGNRIVLAGTRESMSLALSSVVYRSDSEFNGTDVLKVRATGESSAEGDLNVDIEVITRDDPPMPRVPTAQQVAAGDPLVFSPDSLNAITIADAENQSLEVTLSTLNGKITLADNSNVELVANNEVSKTFRGSIDEIHAALDGMRYESEEGFTGQSELYIFVMEADGGISKRASMQKVSILITDPNSVPAAGDIEFPTTQGQLISGNLLEHANDADGDTLRMELIEGPSNGSFWYGNDGTFRYTPNPDFVGVDTALYRISDGSDVSEVITATFNVGTVGSTAIGTASSPSDLWRFVLTDQQGEPAPAATSVSDPTATSSEDDSQLGMLLQSFYLA